MLDIFLRIITFGLKFPYDRSKSYYEIVRDFRNKLPRQQNSAKKMTKEEVDRNPILQGSARFMTVINVSPHQTSLTEVDIDSFYNQLNNFEYRFMFFKKHYQNYTRNLNRFNPKAENKNFELAFLQEALKVNPINPLKPYAVLKYHLKWKWKFTSAIYRLFRRKRKP